jgi:serine/threonine protein kinase
MQVRKLGFFKHSTEPDAASLGVVDPVTLSGKSLLIFKYILDANFAGNFLMPGRYGFDHNTADGGKIKYEFTTFYALAIRKDKYDNMLCDVIDTNSKPLGGSKDIKRVVYPVLGKVVARHDGQPSLRFEADNNKGVVKLCFVNESQALMHQYDVLTTYSHTKNIAHLRARDPLFGWNKAGLLISCQPQRLHKGKSLFDLLNDGLLTRLDRMHIAVALWNKLKEIFDEGYIHRDIKPENVMVHFGSAGWEVSIIDFDFTRAADVADGKCCGTAQFVSPEILDGNSTFTSDTYAMALTIAMLYQDKNMFQIYTMKEDDPKALSEKILTLRVNQRWAIKFDLPDIAADGKVYVSANQLVKLLTRCTDVKPACRPDIETCIAAMEDMLLLEQKQSGLIPHGFFASAQVELAKGREARKILLDVRAETIDAVLIEDLLDEMQQILLTLPDDKHAMRAFVLGLNVSSFLNVESKRDLIDKCVTITMSFLHAHENILQLCHEFGALKIQCKESGLNTALQLAVEKAGNQLTIFYRNMAKTTMDFDAMLLATAHMQRKLVKAKNEIQYVETNRFGRCLKSN